MALRFSTLLLVASSVASGVLIACVSDTGSVGGSNDSGAASDTGTSSGDDAAVTQDGGNSDASTCQVRKEPGVSCFSKDCAPLFEVCCVSLQGGNQLVGGCTTKGDGAIETCQNAKAALWECDSAADCSSGGSVCCVPNLFQIVDTGVCPIIIDIAQNGEPPKDGRATRCEQPACAPGEITACKRDTDCGQAERCAPASIQGKLFGLCIPR